MGAKAIIARSTSAKTRIPCIQKRSVSKDKKGYLKKPEFIKLVDTIGNSNNDENRPLVKAKLIGGIAARNVPITPHKTRTGRVYCRLSTVFAHKLPRKSQLLLSTPLSNKSCNEPNIVKPLKESLSENIIRLPQTAHAVPDAVAINPTDIITFVSEEEINRIPNLDDIPQPAALISFNSTFNESIAGTKGVETDMAEKPVIGAAENDAAENGNDYIASNSTPRKSVTLSPDSSPLIPRMNPLKIFQQFKGFTPFAFTVEPSSSLTSQEEIKPAVKKVEEENLIEDVHSHDGSKEEAAAVEKVEEENLTEDVHSHDEPKEEAVVAELISSEFQTSPVQLTTLPEEIPEKLETFSDHSTPDSALSDTTDKKTNYERRRSRFFDHDEFNNKNHNDANAGNACSSPHITRRKPRTKDYTKQDDTVLNKERADNKTNRSRRNSIFPRQAIKTIKEKGGLDAENENPSNVLYQPSSSSPPTSLDDSVICLSPVPSSSSPVNVIPAEEEKHTESPTELLTQYEPPLKKNRGRPRKTIGNKKSPNKNAPSPRKSDSKVDEIEQTSNGLEVIDGKVYATIKRAGKKGIPLTIEVHYSLLVEPKESCLKKPKNQSWNSEKRFRWADWTKDKELTQILEFESDEKYSLRQTTKNKRHVDPYDE